MENHDTVSKEDAHSRGVKLHMHHDDTAYPPKTAGRHMIADVPVASADDSVEEVQHTLLAQIQQYESVNYVYVVDGMRKLAGAMSIRELFRAPRKAQLADVMVRGIVTVRPHTHQEQAALAALHNNIKAVPVVDQDGAFLGVVPSGEILAILDSEHLEDSLLSAGFSSSTESSKSLLQASAFTYYSRRAPWLVVGLLFGMATAFIIRAYEATLEAEIALAAFIPVVGYICDAVGTQTETLYIRLLDEKKKMDVRAYLRREAVVSALLAVSLAMLVAAVGLLWTQSFRIGAVLFATIFLGVTVSSATSIAIPWLITKFHRDPGVASSPFATIASTITSTLIYLSVASLALTAFR